MTTNRAPLITAIVLLLLPVLYVGSYLALVKPPGKPGLLGRFDQYHVEEPNFLSVLFWPLEQMDYRLRPKTWILPRKE